MEEILLEWILHFGDLFIDVVDYGIEYGFWYDSQRYSKLCAKECGSEVYMFAYKSSLPLIRAPKVILLSDRVLISDSRNCCTLKDLMRKVLDYEGV